MMHSATHQSQLSVLFKVLVFIALSLALTACGGGDGKSNSSALPKAIISGTIDSKVVTSASANSYLPQAQSSVTNQAVPITNDDLSGSIVVYATDTDGNSYQTQTDKDRNFSLSVPKGKSYVIMFVNGAGKFIGVFVHDTSLETAAYTISSNTNIGTISFTPERKATSDKGGEMKKKQDKSKKEADLPKTVKDIQPPNKVNILPFFTLSEGSYSYIKKVNDGDSTYGVRHFVRYYSEVNFKGDRYLAEANFLLCKTQKTSDSCKESDSFKMQKFDLSKVTDKEVGKSYQFEGSVYKAIKDEFLPIFWGKSDSVKGSYEGDTGTVNWVVKFDSVLKSSFSGKENEYLVFKVVKTDTVNEKTSTEYIWHAKGFGEVGMSDKLPAAGEKPNYTGEDGLIEYVYNAETGAGYGDEPNFLDRDKLVTQAEKSIKNALKYAMLRYIPTSSEKVKIGATDYPVKKVSFDRYWDEKRRQSQVNINFFPYDRDLHGNRVGEIQIHLGNQVSNIDFRQTLIDAGSSGLTITNASINVYDLTYGWGVNGNENVTLTWKDDATNTFTVSGLSVDAVAYDKNGSNQVVKKVPVKFDNLTVQWNTELTN